MKDKDLQAQEKEEKRQRDAWIESLVEQERLRRRTGKEEGEKHRKLDKPYILVMLEKEELEEMEGSTYEEKEGQVKRWKEWDREAKEYREREESGKWQVRYVGVEEWRDSEFPLVLVAMPGVVKLVTRQYVRQDSEEWGTLEFENLSLVEVRLCPLDRIYPDNPTKDPHMART